MKGWKACLAGLVILASGLLWGAPAHAQTGITVTPTQLSVAATRGTVETRTLLLRATEAITSVQVIPLDLTRTDGVAILPAAAISPELPADEIPADGVLRVPVRFDLHGVPSGEFTGELLLRYHGGELTVPVTVKTKDHWGPPLLVLLVGVGLGVMVSAYRARGKPRDDVLVRVGQVRAQMRADAELPEPFRSRIDAGLVDVDAAFQAEKIDAAKEAVERVEAVLIKWRKGRPDWLAQLAYQADLVGRLEEGDIHPEAVYVQTVRREVERAAREAPDLDGPDAMRDRLDTLARQINRYVRLQAQLDELNQLRSHVPDEQWRLEVLSLQRRLHTLSPDDQQAYQSLEGDIETATAKLSQLAVPLEEIELAARGKEALSIAALRILAPAPPAGALTADELITGAFVRRRLFTWASYAIAVVLLAAAGFGELYVGKATFGANAWGDYFALLAWGFGAEATRAAIMGVVRGWGLPGIE